MTGTGGIRAAFADDGEMTEEQGKVITLFKELKLKPKLDTVEDFTGWMTEHFSVKKEKEEAEVAGAKLKDKASPTELPHPPYYMQPPRLSISLGEKKDADYDVLKYEVPVVCLQKEGTYSADAILQAVR